MPRARATGVAVEVSQAAKGLVRKLGGKPIARDPFPDGLQRTVYGFPKAG
jgi:hypothetical protein